MKTAPHTLALCLCMILCTWLHLRQSVQTAAARSARAAAAAAAVRADWQTHERFLRDELHHSPERIETERRDYHLQNIHTLLARLAAE